MSMRISSAVFALLLTSCGGRHKDDTVRDKDRIVCAHGAAVMARDCSVDRSRDDRGLVLTVRHADGGFRRLLVTRDGRGVVAADGALPAKVTILGADEIEVMIGGDRYRLPATVKTRAVRP